MPRPRTPHPDTKARLLTAAADEFAVRGLAGAKVDRIAARAKVNKALLYYYFHSKAALYREVLLDVFRGVAAAVEAARAQGGTPEEQLERFIQAVADETVQRPRFPATWLREMAEGGPHVNEAMVVEMRRVLEALGGILREGREAGVFAEVNPFVVHISIIAPLLIFAATAPVRERFRHRVPAPVVDIPREHVVDHVRAATLEALRVRRPDSSRSRRQSS